MMTVQAWPAVSARLIWGGALTCWILLAASLHPVIGTSDCDPTVPGSWNVEGSYPWLTYRSVSFALKVYILSPPEGIESREREMFINFAEILIL